MKYVIFILALENYILNVFATLFFVNNNIYVANTISDKRCYRKVAPFLMF